MLLPPPLGVQLLLQFHRVRRYIYWSSTRVSPYEAASAIGGSVLEQATVLDDE